jgi:tetratricopeptide (TPR) repeat protein
MIEYYLKNEQFDKAQEEMEALRKLMEKMKNPKYIEGCELSIKNAEYYIRIKQGNYEGAEEHYQKQLDTIKPLYPITEASYSHALGKLLFLKGEPERARKYLQKAVDLGGDTKYKKFAEELLLKLDEE